MTEDFTTYDPAESLTTAEGIAYFLGDAFETGDAGYIAKAIGVAARAKGMTEIAKQTGLAREALYRSLAEDGNPSLRSLVSVIDALGLKLTIRIKSEDERQERISA